MSHGASGFECRKMGIKTRPLMDEIAERLSGDSQFKLAYEKLLAVEQRHKQLVQEVGMQRRYGGLATKATSLTQAYVCTCDLALNYGNQYTLTYDYLYVLRCGYS